MDISKIMNAFIRQKPNQGADLARRLGGDTSENNAANGMPGGNAGGGLQMQLPKKPDMNKLIRDLLYRRMP